MRDCRTIRVTPTQVAVARDRVWLDRLLGRTTPREIHAIANARRARA